MHDVRRHAFKQLFHVVVDDLVGDGLQLDVAEVFQELFLFAAAQEHECVGGFLFVEAVEQYGELFAVKLFKDGGDLFRGQLFEIGAKIVLPFLLQEARDLLFGVFFGFGDLLFFVHKTPPLRRFAVIRRTSL